MKKQYTSPITSILDVETEVILAASPTNYSSDMNEGDDSEGYLGTDATSKENSFWLDEE